MRKHQTRQATNCSSKKPYKDLQLNNNEIGVMAGGDNYFLTCLF